MSDDTTSLSFSLGETREAMGPGTWTLPAGAYRIHRTWRDRGGFASDRLEVEAGGLHELPVEKGERVAVTREG